MDAEISELFSLSERVGLIIGGAHHLGFDMACVLAAAGANVVITSRSPGKARKIANRLSKRYDVDTLGLGLDHTDADQVEEVLSEAGKWKGVLHILINNAGGGGVLGKTRLWERNPRDIEKLIETNLIGTLYCCRSAGRIMGKQGFGTIINIASMAGIVGRDRRMYERCGMEGQAVDYSAAKAGVIGMTRDLAACLAPMGIRVNSISPGGFTGPDRGMTEQFVREYSDRTPLGRMGRDGIDIKGATLFLASAASDYVTGHNLVVDGGFSIWQ